MKKGSKEKTKFSKILPNNQIVIACCIELRVQEMTMNEKLTTIAFITSNIREMQYADSVKRLILASIGHKICYSLKIQSFLSIFKCLSSGTISEKPNEEIDRKPQKC